MMVYIHSWMQSLNFLALKNPIKYGWLSLKLDLAYFMHKVHETRGESFGLAL